MGRTRLLGGATVGIPEHCIVEIKQQQFCCWYSESIPHVLSAAAGFETLSGRQHNKIAQIQMRNYLERRSGDGLLCELDADVVIARF